MAEIDTIPTAAEADRGAQSRPAVQALPVTPGKVAMWLFLATEVMFFTGLIGSYIVLRAGSPPTSYSELYPPEEKLGPLMGTHGVALDRVGPNPKQVEEAIVSAAGLTAHEAEELVEHATENPQLVQVKLDESKAAALTSRLKAAGATVRDITQTDETAYSWPQPYNKLTNPLSIDLTAVNTFILICSSVTMVLALSAIQRGDRARCTLFLLATVLIGSTFLSIQVFEYYELMVGRHYPQGISPTHHFRPAVSLFASCFFTMTGFHGAHVTGGVILLTCILIGSLRGLYSQANHSAIELAGLYWHFVDLVWIILFTVVYLI